MFLKQTASCPVHPQGTRPIRYAPPVVADLACHSVGGLGFLGKFVPNNGNVR